MRLFPFFKKKHYFSALEQERIVSAIRAMEHQTSGEIRVFVESKNPYVDPVDRARQVFFRLHMEKTDQRNAVLLYIATKHRQLALYGDEGIYKATGPEYWTHTVKYMMSHFKGDDICEGLVKCVQQVGESLKEKFPYNKETDKNELPDEIVFGK